MDYYLRETPHLIAYIDLLGVKNIIQSEDSQISLAKVHYMYEMASNYCFDNSFKESLTFRAFSDNFIISVPLSDNEIDNVKKLALLSSFVSFFQIFCILQARILLRGCITAGKYFVNENIVWGEALVRGYLVENTLAVFPRVILDNSNTTINLLSKRTDIFNYDSFYVEDVDGLIILNCFSKDNIKVFLNNEIFVDDKQKKLVDILQEELKRTENDEKAHTKWKWTINKYYKYINLK